MSYKRFQLPSAGECAAEFEKIGLVAKCSITGPNHFTVEVEMSRVNYTAYIVPIEEADDYPPEEEEEKVIHTVGYQRIGSGEGKTYLYTLIVRRDKMPRF